MAWDMPVEEIHSTTLPTPPPLVSPSPTPSNYQQQSIHLSAPKPSAGGEREREGFTGFGAMGCASSKRVEAGVVAADVYRPPPTSVAVFDINAIEEPWLISVSAADGGDEPLPDPEKKSNKPTHLPLPILEKLDSFELAPHTWSEVSKALEDLKPALQNPAPAAVQGKVSLVPLPAAVKQGAAGSPQMPPPPLPPQKNHSFHTLEELEAKLYSDNKNVGATKRPKAAPPSTPSPAPNRPSQLPEGIRPVSQNSFLLRDREERERKNNAAGNPDDPIRRWRRNPLDGLPELCPPGGADRVVLYTTTLRGVRRTFEDCERARQLVEAHCTEAGVDERDVSLHGEYLRELRELLARAGEEEAAVPRLFVKGRYVGGVDEVVEMNETGRLRLILRLVRGEGGGGCGGGTGRRVCGGCGGARFLPCTECGGSCKVVAEDEKSTARCGRCNENGLVQCPRCH